jgi:hypothetical protein
VLYDATGPALGRQYLLHHIVSTPRNQSIAFFVDADMVGFPGLLASVLSNTAPQRPFAPVVWSTRRNASDAYAGYWRLQGTGMISTQAPGITARPRLSPWL